MDNNYSYRDDAFTESGTDYSEADVRRDTPRRNNWFPLLLLPIFFALGWVVNDAMDAPADNVVGQSETQVGVGGGPNTTTTPNFTSPLDDGTEEDASSDSETFEDMVDDRNTF